MKVTKIIREYVEERVNEIYADKGELTKELEKAKADFQKEMDLALADIDKYIEERVAQIKDPYNFGVIQSSNRTIYQMDKWDRKRKGIETIEERAEKEEDERKAKIYNAIKDILVNLELGANRKELEEMLAKLK